MKKTLYLAGRGSGKTSLMMEMFLEKPEESIILCFNRAYLLNREDIKRNRFDMRICSFSENLDRFRGLKIQNFFFDDMDMYPKDFYFFENTLHFYAKSLYAFMNRQFTDFEIAINHLAGTPGGKQKIRELKQKDKSFDFLLSPLEKDMRELTFNEIFQINKGEAIKIYSRQTFDSGKWKLVAQMTQEEEKSLSLLWETII
jgi:hypothetical protein